MSLVNEFLRLVLVWCGGNDIKIVPVERFENKINV